MFGKLLQGLPYVIQEPMPDEISGEYYQYIGVLLTDEQGDANGFVQIAVYPEKLEQALAATQLNVLLDGIRPSAGGFAFAVSKADGSFSWYPQERMVGKSAAAYGIQEAQLADGYIGYVTVNDQHYFGSTLETDGDYIFVVSPLDRLNGTRLPVALLCTGACLVFLVIAFLLLTLRWADGRKPRSRMRVKAAEEKKDGPMVDVVMPDGSVRKTESAASRWSDTRIGWNDQTPEQQMHTVLKGMMTVLALGICLATLFREQLFAADSIFLYIINGKWERGLNIFAVTGCIMVVCVILVGEMLVNELLRVLSKAMSAHGETICRLLRSFIKYACYIAMIYYCLALVGVDSGTLLASAGILSLMISFGAKDLVSDIVAGLFIIFEGEFRVGDIVMVGDWRGTVQEIGVRTTKIMSAGEDIKILNNSQISGVINMTRHASVAACIVGIEYGESLERVEAVLAEELPKLKKKLRGVQEGPTYNGVVELADSSVNLRVSLKCAEKDKIRLSRELNREIKLIFDRNNINIPFPQRVVTLCNPSVNDGPQ